MSESPISAEKTRAICAGYDNRPDALIEILHDVQDAYGYVPRGELPVIAKALNLSRAEVHGVMSFYHDFRSAPGGRHRVMICRAEACQSVGCEMLAQHAEQSLKTRFGQTTADGAFTLAPVYCLGNCALGPSAMIDGELHGRVSPQKFDALIAAKRGNGKANGRGAP